MILEWLRAAKWDSKNRRTCLIYAGGLILAQIVWAGFFFFSGDKYGLIGVSIIIIAIIIELMTPIIPEGGKYSTPWHPHHIAERYALLLIIILGEGLWGTSKAIIALLGADYSGFSVALPIGLGAAAIVFALWWSYFQIPWWKVIEWHWTTDRALVFGYGHYFIFASIAASVLVLNSLLMARIHIIFIQQDITPWRHFLRLQHFLFV